ncbi:IclR family transcriptional regulator domain-containing protein [Glycomyces tenuis]|uniref:IclR family transcriptional regulator domain-containing protein n=1 Tax=Glycomyces tenuis TaxID=58116 RepID=UPI00041D17E4|nr:IclR family transcriptional regulator C-terminal domain-containing protein [Glycomyces tenuis]
MRTLDQPDQPDSGSRRHSFQMLTRAIDVFVVISHSKDGRSKQSLANDFRIPERTMGRCLEFLKDRGWVYRNRKGRYVVNPAARIPAGAADHDGIDEALRKFTKRTRRDVALATLDGPHLVLTHLHKKEGEKSLLEDIHPEAIHATAAGKCLIKQLPSTEERLRLLVLNGMRRYTDLTITDPRQLEASLEPGEDMVWSAQGEYCETGACLAILIHRGATYGDAIALTTSVTTAEFEEAREKLVFNLYFTLAEIQPVLGPLLPLTLGRAPA